MNANVSVTTFVLGGFLVLRTIQYSVKGCSWKEFHYNFFRFRMVLL